MFVFSIEHPETPVYPVILPDTMSGDRVIRTVCHRPPFALPTHAGSRNHPAWLILSTLKEMERVAPIFKLIMEVHFNIVPLIHTTVARDPLLGIRE
jgi:hypothetical protein